MKIQNQNPAQTSSKSSVEEANEDNIFNSSCMIFSYTRAQAIADGVLVDVSKVAGEAGFKVPVALTQAVWLDCVAWANGKKPESGQDEAGRLWDVLWMAMNVCRISGVDSHPKFYAF